MSQSSLPRIKYKSKIKSCVIDTGLWPLKKKNQWFSFFLIHGKRNKRSEAREKIKSKVSDIGGLYIYKKGSDYLYVGIGKRIKDRLYSHFDESLGSGKFPDKWEDFFGKHDGRVHIYFKEVKEEQKRKVFEQMLSFVLNPKYDKEQENAE